MELMVDVKVRPKIIPITNNIYKRFGTYLTVDELNQYAQKFMRINRDKFVCDILNSMDFTRKGQIIVAEAFDRKGVDVSSAKFTVFQHFWRNHELHLIFRISFYTTDDSAVVLAVVLREDKLKNYILKWMQAESAYIGLGDNEWWGENGVMCSFRTEIEKSDVDLIAFMSEE